MNAGKQTSTKKRFDLSFSQILILCFSIALLFAFFGVLPFLIPKKLTGLTPNELGDAFGLVNAFMSFLAFIGVMITLWMQREELELQRKEMRQSRMQLKASAEAQKELVEMQLTQAYLHGRSSLTAHKDAQRLSMNDAHCVHAAELEILLNRLQNPVRSFIARQPAYGAFVFEGVEELLKLLTTKIQKHDFKGAARLARSNYERLILWTPALKKSSFDFDISLVRMIREEFVPLLFRLENSQHSEEYASEIIEAFDRYSKSVQAMSPIAHSIRTDLKNEYT